MNTVPTTKIVADSGRRHFQYPTLAQEMLQ